MEIEQIFKIEVIDNNKFGHYEFCYVPKITIINTEKALELLHKKLKQDIKCKLRCLGRYLKISLEVYQRYSYVNKFNNKTSNDILSIKTMPQIVSPENDIKSLAEYFINDYEYNFESEMKLQYDKTNIELLNVELIKIKLLEMD